MGEVYEAEDRKRGEMVALKTVLPKLMGSAKVIARFRREIELSRRISHPNVLKIYDVFELRSQVGEIDSRLASSPCMVMEFLAGKTLADRLQEDGRMPAAEARPLVCQMAAALAAAHRAGVVHRDLKPDNIFLVPTAGNGIRVVLTDFGVARPNKPNGDDSTFTATDVIVGTPTYMAPEQLELEEAMPASDIYTLGLVIYEMITGTFPFQGDTAIQVVFKRIQEDPTPPRHIVPDLDDTWDDLIRRCLERDPKRRLAHAEDIVGILEGSQALPCMSEIRCPAEITPPAKRSLRSWWPFRS